MSRLSQQSVCLTSNWLIVGPLESFLGKVGYWCKGGPLASPRDFLMEGQEATEGIALVSQGALAMNALEPKLLQEEYKMVGGVICLLAIVFTGTGVYKPRRFAFWLESIGLAGNCALWMPVELVVREPQELTVISFEMVFSLGRWLCLKCWSLIV